MVVIRLARMGSKKKPFYNVVATDKRSPRDGRFIEKIGFYNPLARGQEVALSLREDKYAHWLEKGAQPSSRVSSLYTLWLKSGSKDVVARVSKKDRTPHDLNEKPAQRKTTVPEASKNSDKETELTSQETEQRA